LPIRIDPEKCDGCGICVYDCGANVIRFTAKKEKVFPFGNKQCVNCFLCELVCPEKAIEVVFITAKDHDPEAAR
jgi:NAD-dependent dihydropyrimidine dehydrogenase PreA subunit